METRKLGNSNLHITPVGFAPGPSAARAGVRLGITGRQRLHRPPFIVALESGSTGSTRPPFMVWDTPRKWWAAP